MQSSSRYLITAGISLGCISLLYFLSLVCHVPFWLTVPVIAAAVGTLCLWTYRQGNDTATITGTKEKAALLLLAAGMAAIIWKSYPLAEQYGGWDAWCIWNLHANYLAAGQAKWQMLFSNSIGHPDYPLLWPGVVGFFTRLCAGHGMRMVPFLLGFSIMLLIPVLLFLEYVKQSIVAACVLLFLFVQDRYYLTWGVAQYTDTMLAFFFLCALICMGYAKDSRNNIALAAAALGCCMWTKNEGVVLAVIFILFHIKTIVRDKNGLYFAAGIIVPFASWLLFKVVYAPPNDLVAGQGGDTLRQLFIADRYVTISKFFINNLNTNFYSVKICFYVYLLLCAVTGRWPDRRFAMICCCVLAYMGIYLLSKKSLDWHLATSQDRLMHQLMPAMLFVLFGRFAEIRLPLRNKKAL